MRLALRPCIFLEPVSQIVHGGETAYLSVRCVPSTPPLSGRPSWSLFTYDIGVQLDVAEDTPSTIVSGLGPYLCSGVMVYAPAPYPIQQLAGGGTLECHFILVYDFPDEDRRERLFPTPG